jgi:hypothetical protein
MAWVTPWLPTLLVIIMAAAALIETRSPPTTPKGRRLWIASMISFGSFAVAATVWQGRRAADEIAVLAETPASPETERAAPTRSDLIQQVQALQNHVRELEAKVQRRLITAETADKLTTYLKKFDNRRVIVSCIPGDVEAYQYANQVANILKAANWDAQGPEQTKIFGDVRAMGINIFVNGENRSDTVKVLMEGFAKFNIPYQNRITPSQAVPDTETVELFIGAKPSERADAAAD